MDDSSERPFDRVVLIYNPTNPQGPQARTATTRQELHRRLPAVGLGRQPRASRSAFRTTSATPVQVDGEIMPVAAGSEIVIDCLPGALVTIG